MRRRPGGLTALVITALAMAPAARAAEDGITDGPPASISVRVLGKLRPASVELSAPGRAHRIRAADGRLEVDGAVAPAPFALPAGRWRVAVPGAAPRTYRGTIELAAEGNELAIVVRMALEEHVATAVAAESEPGTPREALRALAVVIRSYATTAHGRHRDADLCDLAHCQVTRGSRADGHVAAAREAAGSTAGQVLRLAGGRTAEATFHSSCGGHTADPAEIFGGEGSGAAAVPDPGCPRAAWRVVIPDAVLSRALARLLPGVAPGGVGELRLLRGAGGRVVQVSDGASLVGGEPFARAIDRELGHGKVRSTWFEARRRGDGLELVGQGYGHGVGLCQAGATLHAARGDGYEAILARYFPRARLEAVPPTRHPGAEPTGPRWAPLSRTSSR